MSEYNMKHTGAELDAAISKVQNGYILPEGSISLSSNGIYDVAAFSSAVVNVSESDLSGVMLYCTQSEYGVYTGTGETLDNISIAIGFKPKIFLIQNTDAIYTGSDSAPYSLIGSVTIADNDYALLQKRTSFVLKGDSSQGWGRGGQSSSNYFAPSESGVYGIGANVKAANGVTYNWWAWG